MANYPPNTPYGPPFNFPPQYGPPPPGAHFNMMQQQPYLQQRPPMLPPQNGHAIQYANANAFQNNAQFSQHPMMPHGAPLHAQPPPFYYGSYPPPVPTPSYQGHQVPSYHAAIPVNHASSPSSLLPNTTLPSKLSSTNPAEIAIPMILDQPMIPNADREDGEVSENDLRRAENGAISTSHQSQNIRHLERNTVVAGETNSGNIITEKPRSDNTQVPLKLNKSLVTSSKTSPVIMIGSGIPTPEHVRETRESGIATQNSRTGLANSLQPSPNHKVDARRELAKQALRQLHAGGVGFLEVLSENIVERSLLRELYAELAINVPTPPVAKNSEIAKPQINPQPALKLSEQSKTPSLPTGTTDTRENDGSVIPNSAPQASPTVSQDSTEHTQPQPGEIQKVPSSVQTKQPLPATSTKTMDRSAYLAKLQAAKQAVTQSASQKASKDRQSTEPQSNDQTLSPKPTEIEKSEPQAQSTEMAGIKAFVGKDPTQNDLIRQRLEALKQNKVAVHSKSDDAPKTSTIGEVEESSIRSSPALPKASHNSSNATLQRRASDTPLGNMQEERQYTPLNPFFVSSDRKLYGGLPGLPGLPGLSSSQLAPTSSLPEPFYEGVIETHPTNSQVEDFLSAMDIPLVNAEQTSAPSSDPGSRVASIPPSLPPTETRKRATASDFIEPAIGSKKRRLGPNDRIELVIEVSDEEDNESVEGDTSRSNHQVSSSRDFVKESSLGHVRSFRDVPPLGNFPTRTVSSSAMSTPPIVQGPKDLAKHEEELKLLKLKVAEMELKKKAKRALADGSAKAGKGPLAKQDILTDVPEQISEQQEALDSIDQGLLDRRNSLVTAETEMQVNVDADKRIQAMLVSKAEVEGQKAAAALTKAESELRLNRKAALEAELPRLDAQIEAGKKKIDEMRRQQREVEIEIQRHNEGREALLKELNILLKALENEPDDIARSNDPISSTPAMRTSGDEGEPDDPVSLPRSVSDKMQRTAASISTHALSENIPALDQADPQVDARQESADLPVSALQLQSPGNSPAVDVVGNIEQQAQSEALEDNMDISSSSADEGQIISSHGSEHSVRGQVIGSHLSIEAEDYEPGEISEESGQDEYEPHIIEPLSDLPERQSSFAGRAEAVVDTQDEYEPDSPISVQSSDEEMDIYSPDPEVESDQPSYHDDDDRYSPDELQPIPKADSGEESARDSQASASPKGYLEDYEPPDDPFPVDNPSSELHPNHHAEAEATLPLSPAHDTRVNVAALSAAENSVGGMIDLTRSSEEPGQISEDEPLEDDTPSHFTPYKSPLTQFKSYRFHPQYVSTVPGGFRSLTYSNAINPSQTLCRWELAGGICNDSSCDYQHFRTMPLTDNTLIIELGSYNEGTDPDSRSKYVDGLKQCMAGLRDKGIGTSDPIAISAEIVAYRSQFLGDPSRVVTSLGAL